MLEWSSERLYLLIFLPTVYIVLDNCILVNFLLIFGNYHFIKICIQVIMSEVWCLVAICILCSVICCAFPLSFLNRSLCLFSFIYWNSFRFNVNPFTALCVTKIFHSCIYFFHAFVYFVFFIVYRMFIFYTITAVDHSVLLFKFQNEFLYKINPERVKFSKAK